MFRVKRVYEAPAAEDGLRVLVDRLWPRGLAKADAYVDLWLKDIAPSKALRQWFGHDPSRWPEFQLRYRTELAEPERLIALDRLREVERDSGTVTLLFGARETRFNHAVFLCEVLAGG